jgi:hypothetical protein
MEQSPPKTPAQRAAITLYGTETPPVIRKHVMDALAKFNPHTGAYEPTTARPIYCHVYGWLYTKGAVRANSPATLKNASKGKAEGWWCYLKKQPTKSDLSLIGTTVDHDGKGPILLFKKDGLTYLVRLEITDKTSEVKTDLESTTSPNGLPKPARKSSGSKRSDTKSGKTTIPSILNASATSQEEASTSTLGATTAPASTDQPSITASTLPDLDAGNLPTSSELACSVLTTALTDSSCEVTSTGPGQITGTGPLTKNDATPSILSDTPSGLIVSPIPDQIKAILQESPITNNTLTLPASLDRKLYAKTNAILEDLGGKWHSKRKTHVFANVSDLEIARESIKAGVYISPAANDFYPTPFDLAKEVVEAAELTDPSFEILEPSAGRGALADLAAAHVARYDQITVCEILPQNIIYLVGQGYQVWGYDFLRTDPSPAFDRVLMNPPFTGNASIKHLEHAMQWLKEGGLLVAVLPASFKTDDNSTTRDIRRKIVTSGTLWDNKEGSFKSSGTDVATITVVWQK